METYQKTFWKNARGMEVPVALEDWPKEANYLTVDDSGLVKIWLDMPNYQDSFSGFWKGVNQIITPGDAYVREGCKNSIWKRPS